MANLPTLADLRGYLTTSADDATLLDALAAETAAQAARRRVTPFTADLRQALMRRVARNLAARSITVATFSAFEGGSTVVRVPAMDVEIQRFEAPYPKLPVG